MTLRIEMFPAAIIALNEEVLHHPDLQVKLAAQPPNELEQRIACIAAHCDVLLDGFFYREDLESIAHLLVNKLREKRVSIILPIGGTLQ